MNWTYSKEGDMEILERDEWKVTYATVTKLRVDHKGNTVERQYRNFTLLPCVHNGAEFHPFALGVHEGPQWASQVNARVAWAMKAPKVEGKVEIPWDAEFNPMDTLPTMPTQSVASKVLTTPTTAKVPKELAALIDSI